MHNQPSLFQNQPLNKGLNWANWATATEEIRSYNLFLKLCSDSFWLTIDPLNLETNSKPINIPYNSLALFSSRALVKTYLNNV